VLPPRDIEMSPQIRRFVFAIAALAVIAVGAVAYQTYREALPRLSAAVMERLSDAETTSPPSIRPTPEIARLRGDLSGKHRVTAATMGVRGAPPRSLRANEIATLLDIIRELTVLERPRGAVCVMLPPFRDELTFTTADSSLPIQIDVSTNRALMCDRISFQPFVVPERHIATLTALMAAASPNSKSRP
jgi:hypothetical protein